MLTDPLLIRNHFPQLQQVGPDGRPWAYLDHAATSPKPQAVIDAVTRYYQLEHANVHRGVYAWASSATERYENTRKSVQRFIGAGAAEEIVFVRGATEGINLVAQSFLAPRLQAGDEVVISAMEHHANLLPWQALCQAHGAHLKVIPINQAGELDLPAYANLLNTRTRLVALVHVSNTLGTINAVTDMIATAHAGGIPVLIDAAQTVAHYPVDVQSWDCDFMVFSAHKMFGPTGIGVLYGKAEHLDQMPPYQYGGSMIRRVSWEATRFASPPQRFEAGTPHIAGVIGLQAALDFLDQCEREILIEHLKALRTYAVEQLSAIPGLQVIGQAEACSGLISFVHPHLHPHDLATILAEAGIAVRAGHHCTQPIMDFYGVKATTRASFSIYNHAAEIDRLCEGILAAQTLLL